jgi:hypothetical protein
MSSGGSGRMSMGSGRMSMGSGRMSMGSGRMSMSFFFLGRCLYSIGTRPDVLLQAAFRHLLEQKDWCLTLGSNTFTHIAQNLVSIGGDPSSLAEVSSTSEVSNSGLFSAAEKCLNHGRIRKKGHTQGLLPGCALLDG